MTTTSTIRIHKAAGARKDAFRFINENSIPEFLKGTVIANDNGTATLICVEGTETAPIGAVIGYEPSNATRTGWNTWVIGNAATNLVEVDGIFYKKATVLEAQAVTDEFPEFLSGADIRHNDDGSWTIKTSWGESTGFPGKAYWVLYGTNGEAVDANILTKTEKSYKEYIVCDENGNDIGYLSDIDPA